MVFDFNRRGAQPAKLLDKRRLYFRQIEKDTVRAYCSRQFQRVAVEVQQMPAAGPGILDDAPLGGLVLLVIRDTDRPPPQVSVRGLT